ncbi:MAG TPA: hypothetical protein VH108_07475, partial [Gaiellaceae bacterium]|nr:hypothetical protein [Gaiellaceae bacterium]
MATYSEAGVKAKAGSDVALTPDVSISYPTILTSATIDGDSSQSLAATGAVTLTATQDTKATTTANAQAAGGDVSIGLALALAIVDDEVTAKILRNITAGGAVGLTANGSSDNESDAIAGARGAQSATDNKTDSSAGGDGGDVNKKSDDQLSNANSERSTTGKSSSTSKTPSASTGDSGSSSSTKVEVAAAVAINVITTKSLALYVGGITINAGGVVSAKTLAATIADASAKGETVGTGSDDGIGVGVSINVADITNKATTGTATITGTGLDIEALMNDKNDGIIRRWDDTAKEWVIVDRGDTLPYSPSDGDFFQLTKAAAMQTLVDDSSPAALPGTLKVKSTAGFASSGTLTVVGITGTCNYTVSDGTHFSITGCTGTPEDKAIVTSTTGTTVNGANQTLDGTTPTDLTVGSTTNFSSSGDFTGSGLTGTCHYTSTDSTHLKGVTGCSGTPADATTLKIVNPAGVYKWDDGSKKWVIQAAPDHGTDLPWADGSHPGVHLFRLAEHEIVAEANAGAGKTDVGIAGAVAINIVTNDKTDALVEGGALVTASSADVTLKTKANELDLAKANSEAEDAKSAGVGAAVALNVLTSTETRSEVEDTAVVNGGHNVDVEAASRRQTETEVDMGASGDDTSVAPGVALVVLDGENTTARLGTAGSGLTATGTITVKAAHDGDFSAEAKSIAAGSTAVGVSIALNIVLNWNTLAEVARDVQGTSVEISAESATNTQAHADATTKGADKNDNGGSGGKKTSDQRAQGEVTNNPNTSGNSDTSSLPTAKSGTDQGSSQAGSQGGDSNSGGVGVAASVSLNWVVTTNKAKIGNNAHVTATGGDVKLSAENSTQAAAKSTGLSASSDGSHIAAAVGVDVDDITNNATVGQDAVVSGDGITIEAVNTGGKTNQLIVWGLAGAGGSSEDNGGASVAASIGVEVVSFHTEASVANGAQLISTGDVAVHAENAIGIQNMALSGAASAGGAGVGGAIVVNVFPDVTTKAFIDSNTSNHITKIDASGKVEVSAKSSIKEADPIKVPVIGTLPAFSSVAMAAAASSGGAAVSGSVIVDVFFITTSAEIKDGTQINQLTGADGGSGQSLKVEAIDDTSLTNIAGGLNFSTDGAGVGIGIDVDVINKHVSAAIDPNTTITTGGGIDVNAASTENFHELALDVGGSSSNAAVDGSVIVVVLNPSSTTASVTGTVHAGDSFNITASDAVKDFLLAGGGAVSTSSAGVAVSVIVIDRAGTVDAGVGANSNLQSNGATGLAVSATQSEDVDLISVGAAGGDSAGVAGSVIVDIETNHTHAHIDSGTSLTGGIISGAAVAVSAKETTKVLSLGGTIGIGGTAGVGVGVIVDVFNKDTEASIGSHNAITVSGNVTVGATSTDTFNEISVGGGFGGTASVNVQAAVPVINVTTEAFVTDGSSPANGAVISADGSVGVTADEAMTLNVIAGNISGGGSAAVGAAVSVPVVTKETHAWIGNYAHVNATGNTSITVPTGTYSVHTVDMRFDPAAPGVLSSNTITFSALDDPGYNDGEEVIYDNGGGTSIGGLCATTDKTAGPPTCGVAKVSGAQTLTDLNTTLTVDSTAGFNSSSGSFTVDGISGVCTYSGTSGTEFHNVSCRGTVANNALVGGGLYYMKNVGGAGSHQYQVYADPNLTIPVTISGGTGENHRLVPTDRAGVSSDQSNRFNPNSGDVDYGSNTFHLPYDPGVVNGDQVVYSSGGGTPIGGLVDGGEYYVCNQSGSDPKIFQLCTKDQKTATNNHDGTLTLVTLTAGVASGRSHSIVKGGTTPAGDSSATGPRGITENTDSFRGVAVTANNTDNIGGFGVSFGFSGSAAVNIAGVINVENIHTSAHIGGSAQVNCANPPTCTNNVLSPNGAQSVRVAAANQYYELEVAASLAIGGDAGVAVPITVRIVNIDTYAYIGDGAQVNAKADISVTANGQESIIGVTAGAGGGTVGVAGTVSVTVTNVHTYACTGTPTAPAYKCASGGATLNADNNVLVYATDTSKYVLITVGIAGGFVGVGLAVGIAVVTKETYAYLGANSVVNAKAKGVNGSPEQLDNFVPDGNFDNGSQKYETHHAPGFSGLVVFASSNENVFGLAPAIAGGFVGVAGGVGVTLLNVQTQASIGENSTINGAAGADPSQSVNVTALDYFKSLTIAGGVAGGFVGVAGGVDIGIADTNAQASIHPGAEVHAQQDVEVQGLSRKEVQTYALSAAGGFVGVAISVSVWSVGTATNSNYQDADGTDRGNWAQTVDYHTGDVVVDQNDPNKQKFVARCDITPNVDWTKDTKYNKCRVVHDPNDGNYYQALVDNPSSGSSDFPDTNLGQWALYTFDTTKQPHNDSADWEPPTNALDSPSDSGKNNQSAQGNISSANLVASGNNDSSCGSPSLWNSGTAYNGGDCVKTADGKVWKAKDKIHWTTRNPADDSNPADTTSPDPDHPYNEWSPETSGYKSALNGTTGTGGTSTPGERTNSRLISAMGGAQSGITNASPGGTAATDAIGHTPGKGTTATIDSLDPVSFPGKQTHVYAGGHVHVIANDVLTVFGIAGAVAGGAVGIGGSVLILNVESNTDAGIAEYATISAGGDVKVSASMNEKSTPISFAGGGGIVGIGATVGVLNDHGTQNAHIDDNAAIDQADGGLTVSVNAQRDVHAYAVGAGVGLAAAGAAVAVVNVDGDASATIGDVAVSHGGDHPLGGITVSAIDNVNPDTYVISVAAGIGLGLGVGVAVVDLSGTLKASSGAHGSDNGVFSVTADGTHHASVFSLNITTGAAAIGVTVDKISNGRNTEAGTTGSGVTMSGGTATVQATASNDVDAFAPGGGGGLLQIAIMIAIADLSGHTTTDVEGGITGAGTILISSQADNTVSAHTVVVGVSLIGLNGGIAVATMDQGADIKATVGSGATLGATGAVTVEAKTRGDGNKVTARAEGGAFGALFAGTLFVAAATLEGAVEAHMNGTVNSGSKLDVDASGTNLAEAHTVAVSISLLGALAGAASIAKVTGHANVVADGSGAVSISGKTTFDAESNNTATGTADVGSGGGILALGVSIPTSTVAGSTTAGYDGTLSGSSTGLDVLANGTNVAFVEATPVSIGLIAGAGAACDAEITGDSQVSATVGKDAHIGVGTHAVNLTATANDSATAKTDTVSAGGIAVSLLSVETHDRGGSNASFDGELTSAQSLDVSTSTTRESTAHLFVVSVALAVGISLASGTATIGDDGKAIDQASIGGHAKIRSANTAITVSATRVANAFSQDDGGAGGLLGSGAGLDATATVTGEVDAFVADNATFGDTGGQPGGLALTADDTSTASSETTVGSGAIGFTAGSAKAVSTDSPTVKSWIGNTVNMTFQDGAGHDITVTATLENAEADASAHAYGGSLGIRIGAPDALAISEPTVQAWIGTGTTIVTGGAVKVDAESKSKLGPKLGDNIVGMTNDSGVSSGDTSNCSTDPDTVCFTKHGLITGDSVFYYPNGGTPISGLHTDQSVCTNYNSDGSCHTSLSGGHIYNVIVIDGNTVRLGDSFSGVSILNALSGDPTYGADSVKSGILGIDANRSMVRFSTPHGLETGDAVIYRVEPGGGSISPDFNNGDLLYVRVIDPFTIELYTQPNQTDASAAAFTFGSGSVCNPSCNQIVDGGAFADGDHVTYKNSDPMIFDRGAVNINEFNLFVFHNGGEDATQKNIFLNDTSGFVEGEPVIYTVSDTFNQIGGLLSGHTYYVHIVDGFTIQLADTYCHAVGYGHDNACATGPNPGDHIGQSFIALTRPGSDPAHPSDTQSLRPSPINGLTDGFTYQVHRVDGTHITLRNIGSSTNISISPFYADPDSVFGAAATIGGDTHNYATNKSQELFKAGAALTTSTTCGTGHTKPCGQELDIQLTDTTLDTKNELLNIDGSSLRISHPPTGNGSSDATATGGGGSGIDVSEPTAKVRIGPNVKAYVAADSITTGGDLWITTNLVTRSSAWTENGSGGLVSIPSVESRIGWTDGGNTCGSDTRCGTDNNVAGIGDFSGITGISADTSSSTSQVDASNVTINAGGNIKIEADSSINSENGAKSDSGGGFDDSSATAITNLIDNTAVAIGKKATVTGLTLALNASTSGSNHADANSFVIALFGSSSADPEVNIVTRDLAILDGAGGLPSAGSMITALNGVDVRAHHESFHRSADGGHLCICFDLHFGDDSNNTDVELTDLASGHEGVTVTTGPRITKCSTPTPAWPPLDANCSTRDAALVSASSWLVDNGDKNLALYVQGEQQSSDNDSKNNVVHWSSDVVIYAGPSPLLIIDSSGNVSTAVNIAANGLSNPNPTNDLCKTGTSPCAATVPYIEVNDMRNEDTGDIYMQAHDGTIDGGSHVTSPTDHYWGTFTFRDNWKTVTIINHSARDLVIDNIDVINRTKQPKVTEDSNGNAGGADATFAIVRQVDPTLVTITNDHTLSGGHPNLVINGFINNPIGETDVTNVDGPISATTIRGGSSSFYGLFPDSVYASPATPPHTSLIRSNIVHLVAGTSIGASSPCVTGETACAGTPGSKTLCLDPNNPCVNIDLVVWASHPQVMTTVSGTSTFVDLKTLLRDSTLTDPAGCTTTCPVIDIKSMVAGDSIYVLLYPTLFQSVTTHVTGIHVVNTVGSGPTGDFISFYHPDEPNAGSYSYYPAANYLPGTCTNHGPAPPSCPTPFYELGAFAQDDPSDHEVESTYNFKILDAGATGSQGDVVLDSADTSPTSTIINIQAYIHVRQLSGDVHIHTNGWIKATEKAAELGDTNPGDLRVAQIQSTARDVTLWSPGAVLDADQDVTELASDKIDTRADVVGRNITITAGDTTGAPARNGDPPAISGHGGVGVPGNFLEVHVNAVASDFGFLTITDQAAQRTGWDIDGSLAHDLGSQTGTLGVFVTETDDHMQINTIYTNGDASLVAENGDLRDARGAGHNGLNGAGDAPNVEANNVDLAAYCRGANDATKCGDVGARAPPLASPDDLGNDLKIDSGHGDTQHASQVIVGRVGIETANDAFVTETNGALNVLIAQSLNGNIRLSVREHSTVGDDLNLILPYDGDTLKPTQNRDAILLDYSGVFNVNRTIGVGSAVTNTASINAAGWILLRAGDNVVLGGLRLNPDFTGDVTFTQSGSGDLISSTSPAWAAAAFAIGQAITVSGAPGSNGTYHIIALVDQNTVRVAEANVVTNGTVRNVTVSTQTYPDALLSNASNALTDLQRGQSLNTKVVAGAWIDIHGDYNIYSPSPNGGGEGDTGIGTVMRLHGTITPGPLSAGCSTELEPGRDCHVTRIFGNTDSDTISFDQTFLGGKTRAFGSVAPTCVLHGPTDCVNVWAPTPPSPAWDGEDFFYVNQLQSTYDATLNSTDQTAGLTDIKAGHTLTLDGQSGTDTYVINTTGSQPCFQGTDSSGSKCHNYTINVLDTGAPNDGSDALIVNGVDGPNAGNGSDCNGYQDFQNTIPCPTDDIFLLRGMNYIGATPTSLSKSEVADDPAFVALLHGNFGTQTAAFTGNLTLCYNASGSCEPGQRLTAVAGTFTAPNFVVGRRIHLGGGDSGVWAGDYTIGSIAGDGSYIVLEETLPTGVSLTTEQVPTADVQLHGVTIGVLLGDVTTPDPNGSSILRNQNYERINYDAAINGRLIVNGLGGNDAFFSDDNSAVTTLDGGVGNDNFQIGQIYGLSRDSFTFGSSSTPNCSPRLGGPNPADPLTYDTSCGSLNPEDIFGTVATTRGWLSRGVSQPLVAVGDAGDDTFTVYSNQAPLRLEGGDGNDLFTVRGFALAQTKLSGGDPTAADCDPSPSNPACDIVWINAAQQIAMPKLTSGFSTAAESDIRTGAGQNQVEYNMNAPVSVDGGAGFNKLVILGTEYADHIVVTYNHIYGVGVSVTYTNIQVLEIDALEGDDSIDVLSTAPGVATRVIGGLGNDTINVAGDVTGDVFSLDIDGTSGTLNHAVSSVDPNYNGLVAPGIAYSVARAGQGSVVITQTDGSTEVFEGGCYALGLTNPCGTGGTPVPALDSYTVHLASAPDCGLGAGVIDPNCWVYVTVTAAYPPDSEHPANSGPYPDGPPDQFGCAASNTGSRCDGDTFLVASGPTPPSVPASASYCGHADGSDCPFYRAVTLNGQTFYVSQRSIVQSEPS